MNAMKSYLVSRINHTCHAHNEAVAKIVGGDIFIPHQNNPCDIPHDEISREIFEIDLKAMMHAECGLVAFPIGADCSSEIGWFSGHNRPVVGLIVDTGFGESCDIQYHELRDDWMVKGFLSSMIIVEDKKVFAAAMKDPILKDKVFFVDHPSEVRKAVIMYVKNYAQNNIYHKSGK